MGAPIINADRETQRLIDRMRQLPDQHARAVRRLAHIETEMRRCQMPVPSREVQGEITA